jgi:hypothetical protein
LLPDGTAALTALTPKPGLDRLFGMLYDPDQRALSIKEINEITANAWAGIWTKGKPEA